MTAPEEPWHKRVARIGAVVVILGGALFGYGTWSYAHCGNGLSFPGLRPTMSWVNGECVGVSTELTDLFSPLGPETIALADKVDELNAEVDRRHSAQPERPVLTMVFLGALSSPGPNSGALAAEVKGLKRVAVASSASWISPRALTRWSR